MSSCVKETYEEVLEMRGDGVKNYGPLYRLEWWDRDYRGLKLREPFIRAQIRDARDGWSSPWVNADEIANVVKIMREKRDEQRKLQIAGQDVLRPVSEE